jgi:hypothetical protein
VAGGLSSFFTLTSSFFSQEEHSLSSSTSSQPWLLQITETWELVPLSPICTPYYKSAQIIQQHELDAGCYSPEVRTSINFVYAICATVRDSARNPIQIYCRWYRTSTQPFSLEDFDPLGMEGWIYE